MICVRYRDIQFEIVWRDGIFDMLSNEQCNILVLYNQICVASSSLSVADLFTNKLNSHYSMVFRNSRDASQFCNMAYQIYLKDSKWLIDSNTDATGKPYGNLVLDHHFKTPENQTVVSNILPKEQLTYYIMSNAQVRRH